MVLEPDFEYWLIREREPYPLEERTDLTVLEASTAHIELLLISKWRLLKNRKSKRFIMPKGLWKMRMASCILS